MYGLLTTICALHLIAENVEISKENNITVLSTTKNPKKHRSHVADGDLKLLSELEKKLFDSGKKIKNHFSLHRRVNKP